MTREEIADLVHGANEDALLADGFEDAFVGLARRTMCGLHLRLNCVEVEGDVICRDGLVEGVPL